MQDLPESVTMQVSTFEDVQSAAVALVSASYKRWLEHEQRTDDITAIIIVFQNLGGDSQADQYAAACAHVTPAAQCMQPPAYTSGWSCIECYLGDSVHFTMGDRPLNPALLQSC